MSTSQWVLSLVLLTWALVRNVGTRRVTRSTFAVPVLLVVGAAIWFLNPLPTAGNDLALVAVFAVVGVALGLAASAATRLEYREGMVTATAGMAFAGLWVAMIVGRVVFAQWANGGGARTVGEFSRDHLITGADAWTAAFVVMALGMVLARTLHLAARTGRLGDGAALALVR